MMYGEPVLLTSSEVTFDPVSGIETMQQWEGTMQGITDLAAVFFASGYKVTVEEKGAKGFLRVAMPNVGTGGTTEAPVSKFNITTDYVDVPVWKTHAVSSKVKSLAVSHSVAFEQMLCIIRSPIDAALKGKKAVLLETVGTGEYGPVLTYQTVREGPLLPSETDFSFHIGNEHGAVTFMNQLYAMMARGTESMSGKKAVLLETVGTGEYGPVLTYQTVREGPLLPSETDFSFHIGNEHGAVAFMNQLYAMMARGTESMSQEWPVLKWALTYSAQYLDRRRIPASPNVYTTDALIREFSIPLWVAAQLPEDPDSLASDSAFGWKERARDTETDSRGRVTDTVEFAFAEWSSILYTIVE